MQTPRVSSVVLLCALLVSAGVGCQSHSFYELVPTPAIYTRGIEPDPFDAVPESRQTPYAEVIYVTDRAPEAPGRRGNEYGYARSRSAAFGTMRVWMGPSTWDDLVRESRRATRSPGMNVSTSDILEKGRFPETPEERIRSDEGKWVIVPQIEQERTRQEEAFRTLVRESLAQSKDKDVYLFVHGYNCEFEWPAYVIGQLWHFMGRPGVPIAYSWPAARPGLLRGYQYDRESSEFTVLHMKNLLQLLGSIDEVERVHLLAHSRGTDVTTSALRELRIEYGGPEQARDRLKLGTVVLAAADLDAEVATQRVSAPGVPRVARRFIIYVSEGDRALGTASWMFSSSQRLGMLRPKDLDSEATRFLMRQDSTIEVIDARVRTPKLFSHSYFLAHPGVLSDLVRALRDEAPAGAGTGRPMTRDPSGFWIIDEKYPASPEPRKP